MEEIKIQEDWTINLHEPACDLNYKGCQGKAVDGYRVHGCAFHYACESCSKIMMETMYRSFTRFQNLMCKQCGKHYVLNGFVEVIKLQGGK